jgi:hypothetical protein
MAESVKLRVAVHGDEITVTMPGTTFKITYVRIRVGKSERFAKRFKRAHFAARVHLSR